jgi:hypothetical protein
VQTAYFRGWKAFVQGREKAVSADGMGFILVHPDCQGDCEIDLRWTGPGDFWLAAAVSLASWGVWVWLLCRGRAWPRPTLICDNPA